MASSITKRPRKGNRRLADIREQEPASLPRRSPRLSEKSGRGLPRPGHGGYPLLVASRRSIRPNTNVLDESGQSVPSMFDNDTTLDTTATTEMSIQHDHTYSSPHHSYLPGRDYVLSEGVPPSTSSPNRLYGLDVSDDEDQYMLAPDKGGESSREYNRHYKERTLTPRKQADAPGSSFISSLLSLFIRFVYRIGSVFYLLSNTVFCFDVALLHKLGELFNGCNGKRRWCGFILLVAAFFVIALCLIVPHLPSAPPPPPPPSAPPPPPPPPLAKTTTSYSTVTTTVVPSPSSPPSPLPPPPPPSLTDNEVLEIKSQIKMLQLKLDALSSKNDKDVKLLNDAINSITINKELTDLGVEIDGKLETMKDDERRKTHEMLRLLEEKIVKLSSTLEASTNEGKEAIDRLTLEVHKKPAGDGLSVARVKEIAQDIVDVRYKEIMKLIEANEQSSEIDKIKDQLKVLPALKAQFAKLEINMGTLSSEVDSKLLELSSDLKSVKAAEILGKDDMKKIKVELEGLSDSFKLLESLVKSQANQQTVTVTATPSSSPTLTEASEDFVVDTIRKELLKYSADQVGRFDFALENAGGEIATSSETYDMSSSRVKLLGVTLPIRVSRLHPTAVIQAEVLPGDCWCFGGESGFIVVKLSHNVIIDSVTVQHIPKALWADGTASSAPKEFKVFGQDSGTEENSVLLGSFTYDLDSTPIQTYPIVKQSDAFRFVKFQFETNYGNPSYTCIYRIRVHGSVKK